MLTKLLSSLFGQILNAKWILNQIQKKSEKNETDFSCLKITILSNYDKDYNLSIRSPLIDCPILEASSLEVTSSYKATFHSMSVLIINCNLIFILIFLNSIQPLVFIFSGIICEITPNLINWFGLFSVAENCMDKLTLN